jgi:hypothetical protein
LSASDNTAQLSPQLEAVLDHVADPSFAARLRDVYRCAAKAIAGLSNLNLLKYEITETDAAPDLSLWEELAPVMRDTLMEVSDLLQMVREHFPEQVEDSPPGEGSDAEEYRKRDAERVLHEALQSMGYDVVQLAQAIRNPSIVSDRWNLLAELQRFRSRFCEQIGNLVYETAGNFAEIHRREVVPGYEEAVKLAADGRGAVADLARTVAERMEEVRDGTSEDLAWSAEQLQTDVDAFGGTDAYRALRAQDKRAVIEFRQALGKLAQQSPHPRDELLALIQRFSKFTETLSQANFKDILIPHDREVWAECGVRIEHSLQLAPIDPEAATEILGRAIALAQGLYGRDPDLDTFLRKGREMPLETLSSSFAETVEEFRRALAGAAEL